MVLILGFCYRLFNSAARLTSPKGSPAALEGDICGLVVQLFSEWGPGAVRVKVSWEFIRAGEFPVPPQVFCIENYGLGLSSQCPPGHADAH